MSRTSRFEEHFLGFNCDKQFFLKIFCKVLMNENDQQSMKEFLKTMFIANYEIKIKT